jgi:hypothetical protein
MGGSGCFDYFHLPLVAHAAARVQETKTRKAQAVL